MAAHQKRFDVWYAESIQGRKEADALGAEHQELAALHSAYDEKIDALLSNLTTGQMDELKRIYTAGRTISMPDPREGNYKIREELFREIQQKFETELTDQLAQSFAGSDRSKLSKKHSHCCGKPKMCAKPC